MLSALTALSPVKNDSSRAESMLKFMNDTYQVRQDPSIVLLLCRVFMVLPGLQTQLLPDVLAVPAFSSTRSSFVLLPPLLH